MSQHQEIQLSENILQELELESDILQKDLLELEMS
jgi:hypothetical protein